MQTTASQNSSTVIGNFSTHIGFAEYDGNQHLYDGNLRADRGQDRGQRGGAVKTGWIAIIAVASLSLCVLVVDCTCAAPDWKPGVVTGKWMKPAWTEIETTRVSGRDEIRTTYHDAEYYIYAKVGNSNGEVTVFSWNFWDWNSGERCEVQFRHGRIMTYGFLSIRKPANSW